MEGRSFGEWVRYFVIMDCLLLTVLFIFVPVYPWWAFALFTAVISVVLAIFGGQRNVKRRSDYPY